MDKQVDPQNAQLYVDEALCDLPELVVDAGNFPSTVDALREVMAASNKFYDRDGPVRVISAADGKSLSVVKLTKNNVIYEAHKLCRPVKLTENGAREVTLPSQVASMYLEMVGSWGLHPLDGVSSAPLLKADGSIRQAEGYDPTTRLWCSNVPTLTVPQQPTLAQAKAALKLLRKAFRTFPFSDSERRMDRERGIELVDLEFLPEQDESGFLLALMTAVCRSSLQLAPGALFTAPSLSGAGSGKGLLVRAICAIAFGTRPRAFTTGGERQELDKRLGAELIEAQPALFLDNVNGFALRSDTLASVLTERPARIRILGETRMATLNSAAFIAITGNRLTVTEDLARRFITSELDARCEDPESRPFRSGFLEQVEATRTNLLSAALTIWRWGRQQADQLPRGKPLGSYEQWAEWCRDPLVALGCRDPVERIETLKATDPRRQHLSDMLDVWWVHHKSRAVVASDLNEAVKKMIDPQDRGRQFVATKLAGLVGTRAGGYVITRQPAAGKWGAASYALEKTNDAAERGGHRGHRPEPDEDD